MKRSDLKSGERYFYRRPGLRDLIVTYRPLVGTDVMALSRTEQVFHAHATEQHLVRVERWDGGIEYVPTRALRPLDGRPR